MTTTMFPGHAETGMGKPWTNPDLLKELYVDEEMTITAIADQFDCSRTTVRNWLDKHDIETRSTPQSRSGPWRDRETLHQLYVVEEKSVHEIADELGCVHGTIVKWLDKHEIETRDQYDPGGPWADRDLLRRLYHDEGLSTREIAEELGAGSSTIANWLDKHDIETPGSPRDISGPWQDEETLEQHYIDRGLSLKECAQELGCEASTVRRWLLIHGIPLRERGGRRVPYVHFSTDVNGYERWTSGVGDRLFVHRLLATLKVDDLAELSDKEVHHKNGITWDNRLDNIEPLTPSDHRARHN